MKKILFLSGLLLIASCSSPLEKTFNPLTYATDILEVEKKINKEDKELIESWIISHSIQGKDIQINGLTYQQILDNSKKNNEEKKANLKAFLSTKYTNEDKFLEEFQKIVDERLYKVNESDVEKIGFFMNYKQREGNVLEKMSYEEILKQAPIFYNEKNTDE